MSVKDEIKAVMSEWNNAVAEGNLKELSQLLANNEKTVCYDAYGNKYVGYDSIVKIFKEWFKTMRIHLTSKEMIVNSSRNVAWVADDQHGKIVDLQGKVLMDAPLKWTSVLEKRNNKWVFALIHHSAPASS
jgi:ketosteroid isomerase-like protein